METVTRHKAISISY